MKWMSNKMVIWNEQRVWASLGGGGPSSEQQDVHMRECHDVSGG